MTRTLSTLLVALSIIASAGLAQADPYTQDPAVKDAISHGALITPHGVFDAR
jgi:hypothetical protein